MEPSFVQYGICQSKTCSILRFGMNLHTRARQIQDRPHSHCPEKWDPIVLPSGRAGIRCESEMNKQTPAR